MKVKNINGTSDNICKCDSWLDHWTIHNLSHNKLPLHCVEISCTKDPEVGAHVQKDSETDNNWYILPLCKKHNKQSESLEICQEVSFASANINNTCGSGSDNKNNRS